MKVRVRIAPSPTGPLHVGTARTALFNYLFARQRGGAFILRIEDTDRERSEPEHEREILEGLKWLGLTWDEGPLVGGPARNAARSAAGGPHQPYRQSERTALYQEPIERLLREGKAFEVEGAVVLRVQATRPVVVHDLVRGDVSFPVKELEDFVIAKPTEAGGSWQALYHLAVVLDDATMGITHVIRGEDHLSNTPKHILLQQALGLPTPQYAHVPLLLDLERKKLSKRALASGPPASPDAKHLRAEAQLDVRLLSYRDAGYLPEAMANFLALLGWNPKTTDEVFSMPELIARFRLEGVQKAGAVFDIKKLDWLQRQHLARLSLTDLMVRLPEGLLARWRERAREVSAAGVTVVEPVRPFEEDSAELPVDVLRRALDLWRERGGALDELETAFPWLFGAPALKVPDLPWRGTTTADAQDALRFAERLLTALAPATWSDRAALQRALVDAVDEAGKDRGTVLWPLRYALSGRRESPGPHALAWALGKEETLRRMRKAIEKISEEGKD